MGPIGLMGRIGLMETKDSIVDAGAEFLGFGAVFF